MHVNAQGLLSHAEDIQQLFRDENPFVVCVSETHLTADIEDDEIAMPGYNLVNCYSNSRHTGGTTIYIKSLLKFEVICSEAIDYNYWALWIRVQMKTENVMVGAIYRSPNGNCREFLTYMEEKLNEDCIHQQKTVIMGDLNIDLLKNGSDAKNLKRIIQAAGVKQIVEKETRITDVSATLIDHIITNDFNAREVPREFTMVSDHEIVGTKLSFEIIPGKIQDSCFRDLNPETMTRLTVELIGANWNYTSTDVDILYTDFISVIQSALDKTAPLRKHKSRKHPWITTAVNQAQKERDNAYRKFCLTRRTEDWSDYKILRNRSTSVIRAEKIKYYDQNIDRCKGDSKKMWRTLKDLMGNKKQFIDFEEIDFGQYNGRIEEKFNNFYADSIEEISESIEKKQWDSHVTQSNTFRLLQFEPINLSQLKKTVFELKNKSTSDESLNVKLIKNLFCVIGYAMLHIINTSLSSGKVPGELKTSVIIPIPKVSKPTVPAEFRPINLLPVLDKIIETIVCQRIRKYFEFNGLLYLGQSGFRSDHSCESALQYVCAMWRKEMNEDKVVLSVFVDLQRAFETIDRDILIKKLSSYGVGGIALEWIKDYLDNRFQQTRIGSNISNKRKSLFGVPQGSVLGPLLFIIYVNDIHRVLSKSFVNLFADDTLISVSGKNLREITEILNNELIALYDWLCKNRLKLNAEKTKCMIIGSRANCKKYAELGLNVKICDSVVSLVSEIKYLGVYLDPQLSFSNQIDYLCKKIGKKIGFFYRISRCLSQWTKLLIFNTIILPHFDYCCSLLVSCNQEDIQRLQIQQNKAMRIILNCDKYTPIKSMLQSLNWLPIVQSIKKANITLIYKIEHNKMPTYLKNFLDKRSNFHDHNIRSRQNFHIQPVKTTALQKSLFFEGVRLFNALPESIRSAQSISDFNHNVSKYLMDMYMQLT